MNRIRNRLVNFIKDYTNNTSSSSKKQEGKRRRTRRECFVDVFVVVRSAACTGRSSRARSDEWAACSSRNPLHRWLYSSNLKRNQTTHIPQIWIPNRVNKYLIYFYYVLIGCILGSCEIQSCRLCGTNKSDTEILFGIATKRQPTCRVRKWSRPW